MKNQDLLTASYDYDLPPELIATRALDKRDESRLLIYDESKDEVIHTHFKNLPEYLSSEHHLVLNQSKVFPCRFFANKKTGGKVEVFILSLIPVDGLYEVMLKSSGKKNIGDEYFCEEIIFTLEKIEDDKFYVKINLSAEDFINKLEEYGNIPIPPYIRDGIADAKDKEQYQTVYAKDLGSVAAPTAGLHFTDEVFKNLENKGIDKSFVTLHVGAGTFRPVKDDNILEHKMHSEIFELEKEQLHSINAHKDHLIAVGTTSLRVLESLWDRDHFKEIKTDDTDIFLYPGVPVASISGLITNFHLPKSTLIMLVSSLVGREKTLELYSLAVKEKYRFFSYGDSMLILRDPKKVNKCREQKA
jgi:S-adenosylmethionine:tRNA ribosyltransferase-isomerase